MAKNPGVGYPAPPISYFGTGHGWPSPCPLEAAAVIEGKTGMALEVALAHRYAQRDINRRRAGVPGLHQPAVKDHIEEAFRTRTAWWLPRDSPRYETLSGTATVTEALDAYAYQPGDAGLRRWLASQKPEPDPGPVTPPVVPPAPAGGLRPLSPAAVRVKELRSLIINEQSFLALAPESLLVEALRFYRLLRRHLGDTRPLPQEDRS